MQQKQIDIYPALDNSKGDGTPFNNKVVFPSEVNFGNAPTPRVAGQVPEETKLISPVNLVRKTHIRQLTVPQSLKKRILI